MLSENVGKRVGDDVGERVGNGLKDVWGKIEWEMFFKCGGNFKNCTCR